MSIWNKIKNLFGYETVRARDSKGRYIKDDPTTPENEAFVTRKKKPTTSSKSRPKRRRVQRKTK
jgi:hypothetical protein